MAGAVPDGRGYPPEKVTAALVVLAELGGNVKAAAKRTGISQPTLRDWRSEKHAAQYDEIRTKFGRELEEQLITTARVNAHRAGEVEAELIERMRTVSDKDAPAALRAITDAKAKNVDKLLSLTGRPSAITENRDPSSILESLVRLKVLKVDESAIDTTATEDAEPAHTLDAVPPSQEPQ